MAQVPYDSAPPGEPFPTILPRESVPDDYSHVQARPDEFGGLVARGLQQAGQGAQVAAKFFGEAAADNASNEFQGRVTKLLYGDPQKTVIGPDGKPQQDTGYFGLKGRAALDARPGLDTQIDEELKNIRAGLTSPEQQLQFDNFSRRYRALTASEIGRHADQQSNIWYGEVNKTTAEQAKNLIAANADKPEVVAHATSDLIGAYVKNAELAGGGDELRSAAIARAKSEAAIAQIGAISVNDPARAQRMTENYKEILGEQYERVAASVRNRADLQNGIGLQRKALGETYTGTPPAYPGTVPLAQLSNAIEGQESGHRANVPDSSTGAVGLRQIEPATFQQYARPGENIRNADDNKAVGNRILADYYNRYGGDPYRIAVAYYSGAGNVAPPGSATPWIRDIDHDKNGKPIKSVSQYVSDIAGRLGVAPQAPYAAEAAAERYIMTSDATDEVKQHALTENARFFRQAQIATEGDARARREASDGARDAYTTQILTTATTQPAQLSALVAQIDRDPKLDGPAKIALHNFATNKFGLDEGAAYGEAYPEIYRRILLPPGDPQRINDATDILTAGAPGGGLSPKGTERLMQVFTASRKNTDQMAVNQAKASLITYMKNKLSFEDNTGPIKIRDPKGEAIFNGKAVPMFESAYDNWIKEGKNPWEFLTQDNVDKLVGGLRSKSEMAAEKIAAEGGGVQIENAPIPEAPKDANADAWKALLQKPPVMSTGQVATPQQYALAINLLAENPTDKVKAQFNKSFGADGAQADDVLAKLKGEQRPQPAAATTQPTPAEQPAVPQSTGFRPGSLLDRLFSVRAVEEPAAVATPPGATSPARARRLINIEQGREGFATVQQAP